MWPPKRLPDFHKGAMMELRFVSREGDAIVFETSDGKRMSAVLDDQLRDAVRQNTQLSQVSISPKDIQQRVRAGNSVAEIAQELDVSESTIEPFAAPIIDEMNYILQSALDSEVPDGSSMKRFEDLITAENPGCSFSLHRKDDTWMVRASGQKEMLWSFETKSRHLEPADSQAQSVARTHANRDIVTATMPIVNEEDEPEEKGASVHDLVEELRSRRKQEPIRPAPAKGRASLPSWDEIVLGTTHSDSESE
jgi:hypothetical protein